jgi:hypothetical protein
MVLFDVDALAAKLDRTSEIVDAVRPAAAGREHVIFSNNS